MTVKPRYTMAPRMTTRGFEADEARANWLRQRLFDLDLRQLDLAEKLGIKDTRISQWVTHEARIPDKWWVLIEKELS